MPKCNSSFHAAAGYATIRKKIDCTSNTNATADACPHSTACLEQHMQTSPSPRFTDINIHKEGVTSLNHSKSYFQEAKRTPIYQTPKPVTSFLRIESSVTVVQQLLILGSPYTSQSYPPAQSAGRLAGRAWSFASQVNPSWSRRPCCWHTFVAI